MCGSCQCQTATKVNTGLNDSTPHLLTILSTLHLLAGEAVTAALDLFLFEKVRRWKQAEHRMKSKQH